LTLQALTLGERLQRQVVGVLVDEAHVEEHATERLDGLAGPDLRGAALLEVDVVLLLAVADLEGARQLAGVQVDEDVGEGRLAERTGRGRGDADFAHQSTRQTVPVGESETSMPSAASARRI